MSKQSREDLWFIAHKYTILYLTLSQASQMTNLDEVIAWLQLFDGI